MISRFSGRRAAVLATIAAVLIALAVVVVVLSRQRVHRRTVFRRANGPAARPPIGIPPVEQWTHTFASLPDDDLDALLDQIEKQRGDLYAKDSLAYLHARVRIEKNDLAAAERKLAPFLAKGNAFRDLALFHQAEIDTTLRNEGAASRDRTTLIFEYPNALHRDEAIDDETEFLARSSAKALIAFSAKLYPTTSAERRRDLDAHVVEALIRGGDANGALTRALQVLRGGTTDDREIGRAHV